MGTNVSLKHYAPVSTFELGIFCGSFGGFWILFEILNLSQDNHFECKKVGWLIYEVPLLEYIYKYSLSNIKPSNF